MTDAASPSPEPTGPSASGAAHGGDAAAGAGADGAGGGGATAAGGGRTDGPRRLVRSRQRVVAGVCGGLGRHWGLDPVVFRVVLTVLAVTSGLGLILYGFAWLLVPLEGEEESEGRRLLSGRVDGQILTALVFALVGCGLFPSLVSGGGVLPFTVMLSLAVAGSAYWTRQRGRASAPDGERVGAATAQAVADAPPEATAPPAPGTPSWWRHPAGPAEPAYLWGPADVPLPEHTPGPKAAEGRAGRTGGRGGGTAARRPARSPAPRRPFPIGGLTFLLAVAAGVGGARALWIGHPLGTSLQFGLACALAVLGLGLAVSTRWGRTGGRTVFWALLTAVLLAGSTLLPPDISSQVGNRRWSPTRAADVAPQYELGAGDLRLDLSRLRPAERSTVATRVEIGAGQVRVNVPEGVTTRLHLDVGSGGFQLPDGQEQAGLSGYHRSLTLPAHGLAAGEKPRGLLDLDVHVGVGMARVERATPLPPSGSAPTPTSPPAPTPTSAPTGR
ncbi:PspC domain-containing protein [Streptomyces sp. NPDC059740]|uniref:PspC domain-containing protein n=1 Tax=Streptomyces sp. NPDC059740 TaxID=3346926 RepID=UPI0036668AF5